MLTLYCYDSSYSRTFSIEDLRGTFLTSINTIEDSTREENFYREEDQCIYDTSSVYSNYWKNESTFAYGGNKSMNISDTSPLTLCDSYLDCAFPVENKILSGFGFRRGIFHKGIDIDLDKGDSVIAAFSGKVRYAKYNNGGFGNLVIIRHPNGLETYYAHLSKLLVKPNDIVEAGQLIGLGGSTGRSYGPHLHFEVRIEDRPINPSKIFDLETFTILDDSLVLNKDMFAGNSSNSHSSIKSSGQIYYVRKGDCLSTIAERNRTTVENLCRLNGLTRNSILQIGQKIRL